MKTIILFLLITSNIYSRVEIKTDLNTAALIENVTTYTTNHLKIDDCVITVKCANIPEAAQCVQITNTSYEITFQYNLTKSEIVQFLIHEIYHVYQYKYAGLNVSRFDATYKNKVYTNETPYLQRLYEVEAINFEKSFIPYYYENN